MAYETTFSGRKWELLRRDDGFYLRSEFDRLNYAIENKMLKLTQSGRWRATKETLIQYEGGKEVSRQGRKMSGSDLDEAASMEIDRLVADYRRDHPDIAAAQKPSNGTSGRRHPEPAGLR